MEGDEDIPQLLGQSSQVDTSLWLVILGNLEITLRIGRGNVLGQEGNRVFFSRKGFIFISIYLYSFLLLFLFFRTGFLSVALAVLELIL